MNFLSILFHALTNFILGIACLSFFILWIWHMSIPQKQKEVRKQFQKEYPDFRIAWWNPMPIITQDKIDSYNRKHPNNKISIDRYLRLFGDKYQHGFYNPQYIFLEEPLRCVS